MPNVGPIEIIVVLLILVVIFGPKRIPELGRSVGQGMRNFKQSVTGRDRDDEPRAIEDERTEAAGGEEPYEAEPVASSARPDGGREGAPATPDAPPVPDRTREPGL